MIGVSVAANTVEIPSITNVCGRTKFDSTYPVHLNGIIDRAEFQQSIDNINRAISVPKSTIVFVIVDGIFFLIGFVLFTVGGFTAGNFSGFPPLIGVAIGLVTVAPILLVTVCIIHCTRHTTRIQKAIAEESRKYSTRTPIPCSWRLHSSTISIDTHDNHRSVVNTHILIEIGHFSVAQNGYSHHPDNHPFSQQTVYFNHTDNFAPPPSYNEYEVQNSHPGHGREMKNPTEINSSSYIRSYYM